MDNKKNEISIRRSQLSPAKQALLEKRLRGECKSGDRQKLIPRRSQDNPVPLSFAQQRLWFLAQLEPDNPFYNVAAVASLKGKLNFKALQDSFQEIINRHEALRCNFKSIEGQPVAFINSTKTLLFPVVDISELPKEQQTAEVKNLAYQEAQQPFDLSSDLLLRVKLLRLNPEEHILLFTMHHIVSDGWSIGVLLDELATLYPAFYDGKVASLPELPIQYGDFAIWQQDYLQGEALTAQINYWKQQLGGSLTVLQLPTDYPRPAVQSYKGKNYSFTVSKSLTTALKGLSQQTGTTLFMTLLAAFKTLLYRYSQEDDIIIGTAIANRNLPQIEKLIGFFVNTLVLRTDVGDNPSFLDLLARVKEVTLDAYTHQDLPFEKLVEEIQPERNLSHNPLFQVWFALNNNLMPTLEIGELTLTISEADSATAQFDLSLDMVEQHDQLIGTFEYSDDLFNADTITRIAEHFQTLLAGIIANPQQQIALLPLLTKAEENDLLWKWNNNQVEYPQRCIHQLFEDCVNKTPNAVAVVFEQQRLTYQQLNNQANQLAHYLQKQGVKPEVLVGICLERSVEMIVALLAVLKAGGAYVPLDPAYPQERLSLMLQDAQVSLLLTTEQLVSSLPVENIPIVCLDKDWQIITQHSQQNPATDSTPDNLAYVIYTSGSTGKSKGVAIAHRSLVNAFAAWTKAYHLNARNSHLQMASFAFDVFAGDWIRALCSGAKLVLCPRQWLLEADKLYQLMLVEQVDSADFVPVVLRNLVQYLAQTGQNLHFMRLLVVGSDTLYLNDYQTFGRFCGAQTRLINSYGVTEATIDSSYFEGTPLNLSHNGLVPIGRPFANTEIYILDSYLQPVPIGIAGELYIGGVGLAQNYLNRPDLTKEKFILWNGEKRLYKTGDQAKYLADGTIEFLGRLDYQIKLRGFRIELGEIEAAIKQHPSVGEAVVIAREDIPGDRRLVAYFVQNSQFERTNQQSQLALDLREFLEQKLPDYTIPAAFVALEALPITPNGKLDRRALPAPEATQLLSQSDFVAPSTPIEEMLVNIWTEVLGIENIGIHHNFFNLGGHSLLATRLAAQIRQVFQIELPLRRIFEKPTIAGLAKDIETAKVNLKVEATKIERIERSQHLPLSFAQQRFWFLAQLEPHSSSYNMPGAVHLQGQLNIAALQQSFNEILRRHEALRTNFQIIEGQPVAVILPPAAVQLPIVDISELSAHQQELQVQQQAIAEARQPFDLNDGLLLRVKLLRLSEQEHVLLLTMHHIASDAWSTDILVREFATLYQAFCDAQPALLAELPIQYVDFAAWQRQWLQGERLESQISYWRKQLEGVPKLLELPTDFPRPPVQSFRGTTYTFELPQQLSVALNQLSQQQGTTLFMTLLAAFQTLLYRVAGSEDIAIASPIGSRNQAELEGLIGLFVNTLVLRTNLAGNPTFEELLNKVRSVALSAYAHQDLPFELLVEELQPQRNLSHTPLFQVMFVLQNAPMSALELPGLTLSYLPIDSGTAKFDLTLDMTETVEGLVGTFEYNTDLFTESTIERMAGHLQTLLAAIVNNPQQRLSQLPLLTASEQQLLKEWNDTTVAYPTAKCLHELFEQQVEKTPDAVAVVYEHQQLTYRQLNAKANQLAHYLRSLGVKPEVVVGICVERSLEIVIGLLAILKAGGAYLPLDPTYPQERLAFTLEDAQVSVLLTQQHLVENLPSNRIHIVCLDTYHQSIVDQSSQNPISESTSDRLAYIIYTSGSTGQPKGVLVNHSNVVRLFAATEHWYNFNQKDVWTLFHSIAFDFSVWEIWGALLYGGRLVVVPYWVSRSPEDFYQLLLTQQVTVLNQTPSAFRQLMQVEESWGNSHNNLSLRTVIFGGEALQIESLRPWFERHGDRSPQLVNMYGITETTVHVTYRPLTMADLQLTSPSLIGRPIPDLQVYILDSYQQPVPIGVPGEMYIGGAGVVRGYLNRPELTEQRFISNPFSTQPSARLYRSGDLARYLPNGDIEYLGRIDHQIKIRGFRIELGEIEAVISQYPGVRETVVIVREDLANSQQIVAYVVAQSDRTITSSQLRQFLESKLPNYMIPAAFVMLAALPITPNGKVDRKALPAPESTQLLPSSDIVPAATPIEDLLTGIWAEVLAIDNVGIYNNFFELGGHSLIATRVISQIRQVFQIELPLRCLFEKPTIAELAKEITKVIKLDSGVAETKIEPVSRLQKLPLSFAQQRLWFLAQLEPNSASYNIPVAVRLQGQLNVAALQQSFNAIINRHEALRTNFHAIQGQAIVAIAQVAPLTLPVFDLSNLSAHQLETEVKKQALQAAQKPFDLKEDLLLRVKLLRLGAQEHVVLLTMHHIVSDGWSTGVLVQELATLYQAFCHGESGLPLAPLPIQYVDFAAWQRQWLQGEVLETQMAYWRKQLEDAPKVLELPTDYPRPAVQTFRGATYSFTLSHQLSLALNKLSQQQGTTLFMTLLAAFQTLLYRVAGSEDLASGSAIANRNRAEVEGLIGFFVNTLVLRTNLAGNPTFSELLKRVREVALGAYAHQDVPFELLVEELQPQRDLSHTPLFQVMFVLQNAPMSALELPGLTLTPLEIDSGTAQFDLTLSMTETESGLVGSLEYNTDLFAESSIQRMTGHLQTLLAAIVNNPQQRLSQLPLLTASEQQLFKEWNDTTVAYPSNECLHELFEQQVEKTPDAVAVVYENQQLTYKQLNAKANQLAHYLRSLGVKPEVVVGICLERSLEMVIGLLAILKAGGAYLPLDPTYPQQRLAYMLEDSQPGVLIIQQHLGASLPTYSAQVIYSDRIWELIDSENTQNPISNTTIDNLAYVIYTSGSTGKPKGAMNSHRGVCNRLLWMQDAYQLTAADNVLQKTPFSFDVSVWEFFWTLIAGARLVITQPEGHKDPNYLVNLIYEQQITTLHFVPSMLQAFLEVENLEKCQCIKRVITSGEALPAQLQQRFFNRLDAQLHNLYGPTEAAIDVTFWQCQDNVTSQNTVPIGRPIANTQIYILDRYLNPVPVGVTGEIYIGGVGVGRGYLNRPELTAEKFIPNPFSNEPSGRLYKTGDLARYLANGEIEYIGRIDNQVKIRGLRIELGEIEAVISQFPGVRETVVTVREDLANSQQIVAYAVARSDRTLTSSQLRQFLESKLPNYMIPATFVMLEALPLTPNGKVDRQALPAPETRPQSERNFVQPRTSVEETLAQIWSQVLGLELVGVDDNFFALGGDSILSLQIIAQANRAGVKLTPKQMFQHQTIAELAKVASTDRATTAEQDVVIGTLPLTPIQHWLFEKHLKQPHHWNQSVLLVGQQKLDAGVLETVLQHLLVHHDALRLRFQQDRSSVQQFNVAPEETVPLTKVNLSGQSDAEQKASIEAAADRLQASLNLSQGSLLKAILFDLGATKRDRLLIVIHHLAIDGVSWRILLEDLQTAYQQLSAGQALHLPPKTTSFRYWATQLKEYANSETLQSQLNYWLAPSGMQVCNLPVDRAGDNTEISANTVTVSLSPEETQTLLQQIPQAYKTQINDVLLTALGLTFTRWIGDRHLLVDLEGHGREEIFENVDLSRTVGWFTAIFPVLLNIESTQDLAENLKSVKEQLRQIPNRGMGYGLLRYLSSDRSIITQLQQIPQAQVIFNYLGQIDQVLSGSSLFQPATESSGFDTSLQENRHYLLEVDAVVVASQLQVNWKYSQNIHQTSTIENLAHNFVQVLRLLIARCHSLQASGYTPADFPLANLDWQTLNRLVNSKQQIEDIYPLSSVQSGMLFHLLYAPKSSAYLYQTSCTLQGDLNLWAFEQAWNQVIQRHPILRTAFVWEELDTPMQVVIPQVNLYLQHQDWQNLSASDRQTRLQEFLQADLDRGFDLDAAPLMRLTLIQISPDSYHLIWSCHHLLIDGWSMPLLLKEVFAFYKALCRNQQIQLPATRPYRDYIAWLQQQNLRSAETYWRQTLAGIHTPTPLPLQQTAQKLLPQESNSYEQNIQLSQAITNALTSLTRQYKVTLNTLIQGIWTLLLSHYSGETDIVFGATVSGRPPSLTGAESTIGLFINTIPVRVKLSKVDLLLPWLIQIQHSQVEAREYEYSPLVKIQEWSQIPRGLPLFNSIVVFENYPVDAASQSENIGLEIQNVRSWSRNHYPLTLRVVPGLELSMQILWMSETTFQRVNAGAIARISQHLPTLLSEISKNPHVHIQELLKILTEVDKQQHLEQKSELQATERQKLKIAKRKAIRDF